MVESKTAIPDFNTHRDVLHALATDLTASGLTTVNPVFSLESNDNTSSPMRSLSLQGGIHLQNSSKLEELTSNFTQTNYLPLENKTEFKWEGSKVPQFDLKTVEDGTEITVDFADGTIRFLDIWATWCGPCQGVMAKNEQIMRAIGEKWAGKAQIVGISLDDNLKEVQERVKDLKWTSLTQLWTQKSWESTVAETLKVRGLPCGILVDGNGVITWRGHPAKIDVQEEIQKLVDAEGDTKTAEETDAKSSEKISEFDSVAEEVKHSTIQSRLQSLELSTLSFVIKSTVDLFSDKSLKHQTTVTISGKLDLAFKSKFIDCFETLMKEFPAASWDKSDLHFQVGNENFAAFGEVLKSANEKFVKDYGPETNFKALMRYSSPLDPSKPVRSAVVLTGTGSQEEVTKIRNEQKTYAEDPDSVSLACEVQIQWCGADMPPVEDWICVKTGDKGQKIDFKDGKVRFVDFWATWCGPCQGPMTENEKILEKNAEIWGDKVEFVGLTMDAKLAEIKPHVDAAGWNRVKFLAHSGGWNNPVSKKLIIQGIPDCVIVDGEGKIRWRGHPSTIDIAELLNKVLAGGTLNSGPSDTPVADRSGLPSLDEISSARETLKEFSAELKTVNNSNFGSQIRVTLESDLKTDSYRHFIGAVVFGTSITRQEEVVKAKIAEFKEKNSHLHFKEMVTFRHTESIERKTSCSSCEKIFDVACDTIYQAIWGDRALCSDCEEKRLDTAEVKDEVLQFVIPSGTAEIDALLVGAKSLKKQKIITEVKKSGFPCYCDYCGSGVEVPESRYKCANCGDFDFCGKCAKIWLDIKEGGEERKSMIARFGNDHPPTHVLIHCRYPELM